MGNYLEGNSCGLIEVLSRNFPEGTEEEDIEKPQLV
jgi:hypothetical protein